MKDAVFGALYSLLKATNFESKRLFISEYDGLAFLERLVCAELNVKLHRRVLQLLNDLLTNDEFIFAQEPSGDKNRVHNYFTQNQQVIKMLVRNVVESDRADGQTSYLREFSLMILVSLTKCLIDVNVTASVFGSLSRYQKALNFDIENSQDSPSLKLLMHELDLVD